MPVATHDLQQACSKAVDRLRAELSTLRTGRASPALVEHLQAEYYGNPTPLIQLASITTPEPTTILLQVWDANATMAIQQAVLRSGLGVTPLVEGQVIRIVLPPLSEERRRELVKVLKQKGEQTRVRIRRLREEALHGIRDATEAGTLSEDAAEAERKNVQRAVDDATVAVEEAVAAKERELMTV